MNIYQKLNVIQCKLKAPKSQYNSFGKYSYRNCEDILEALKPLLSEVGAAIFITDSIEKIDSRFYVKATVCFIDTDNEGCSPIIATAFAREEDSKKGMDGSQVTGATSSYARKYALNGLFAIDDTKDVDGEQNDGNDSAGDIPSPENEAFDTTVKYASKEQIELLTKAYGSRLGEFLEKAGVTDLKFLPYDVAESSITKLKAYYAEKDKQKGA